MNKISETILSVLLTFVTVIAIFAILIFNSRYFFLAFIVILIYIILLKIIKSKTKLTKELKEEFSKLGYKILSEKEIKGKSFNLDIKPTVLINNIPLNKYQNVYSREFIVLDKDNNKICLKTKVKEDLDGNFKIQIESAEILVEK